MVALVTSSFPTVSCEIDKDGKDPNERKLEIVCIDFGPAALANFCKVVQEQREKTLTKVFKYYDTKRDKENETALTMAAHLKLYDVLRVNEIVKDLMNLGADANAKNGKGQTALQVWLDTPSNCVWSEKERKIRDEKEIGTVKLLIAKTIVNLQDGEKNTALHFAMKNLGMYACYGGEEQWQIIELLLNAKAIPHLPNERGETPLEVFREHYLQKESWVKVREKYDYRYQALISMPSKLGHETLSIIYYVDFLLGELADIEKNKRPVIGIGPGSYEGTVQYIKNHIEELNKDICDTFGKLFSLCEKEAEHLDVAFESTCIKLFNFFKRDDNHADLAKLAKIAPTISKKVTRPSRPWR